MNPLGVTELNFLWTECTKTSEPLQTSVVQILLTF